MAESASYTTRLSAYIMDKLKITSKIKPASDGAKLTIKCCLSFFYESNSAAVFWGPPLLLLLRLNLQSSIPEIISAEKKFEQLISAPLSFARTVNNRYTFETFHRERQNVIWGVARRERERLTKQKDQQPKR